MAKATWLGAVLAVSAACALPAKDFPLQFKTIPAQDVMTFPGGYGLSSSLSVSKPEAVRKEPKANSRHPLYAQWRLAAGEAPVLVRLDESQGTGKGYDQLIADMNQNGDLTDDAVVARVVQPEERANSGWSVFGPIAAAADKRVAGGRPVFYAQTFYYSRSISSGSLGTPAGGMRLKAGWYLETTVELNGVKQKVGVYDSSSNLRLGDLPKSQIVRYSGRDSGWMFDRGDAWLVDVNGSGRFEDDVFQSEAVPFGPLVYLGAKPFKFMLSDECQTLSVEPWSEPLAEVALGPHGEQVHSLTLAWERQGGQWQLLRPTVVDGKIQVPPGNYRLYYCNLLGKAASGEQTAVTAIERNTRMPVSFVAGKANKLECGGPLAVKVTATKTFAGGESFGPFDGSSSSSARAVRISAQVVGAEGEVYSAYYTGEKLKERPPKPSFSIVDAAGQEVAHGDLEYG